MPAKTKQNLDQTKTVESHKFSTSSPDMQPSVEKFNLTIDLGSCTTSNTFNPRYIISMFRIPGVTSVHFNVTISSFEIFPF
jgi:hypothetical protein